MAKVEAYERAVKRLEKRDWDEVRAAWMTVAARLQFAAPGQKPDFPADETPGLKNALPKNGEDSRLSFPQFSAPLLHQGIYLLHKAANVLVAAHDQVIGGLPTWSISSGYHSALFAAEAFMNLLGVSPLSFDRTQFIADIWPGPEETTKAARDRFVLGSEMNVIVFPVSISHFHRWAIFQRLLNTTNSVYLPPL